MVLSVCHVVYMLYRVGNVPLIYPIAQKGFVNIYVMLGVAVLYSLWGTVGVKVFAKAEASKTIVPLTMFVWATIVLTILVVFGGFLYLRPFDTTVCEVAKKKMLKVDAMNWEFDDHAECFGAGLTTVDMVVTPIITTLQAFILAQPIYAALAAAIYIVAESITGVKTDVKTEAPAAAASSSAPSAAPAGNGDKAKVFFGLV